LVFVRFEVRGKGKLAQARRLWWKGREDE